MIISESAVPLHTDHQSVEPAYAHSREAWEVIFVVVLELALAGVHGLIVDLADFFRPVEYAVHLLIPSWAARPHHVDHGDV